jgi:hypothetical protein
MVQVSEAFIKRWGFKTDWKFSLKNIAAYLPWKQS